MPVPTGLHIRPSQLYSVVAVNSDNSHAEYAMLKALNDTFTLPVSVIPADRLAAGNAEEISVVPACPAGTSDPPMLIESDAHSGKFYIHIYLLRFYYVC